MTSPENVKKILIVKQHNQLGDMLCCLYMFAAVRKRFPSAHITLITSPVNFAVMNNPQDPYINRTLLFDKTKPLALLRFASALIKERYDIGIVPCTVSFSRTSHIINKLSGAKLKVGINSANGKQNKSAEMLNVKGDFIWTTENQTERYLDNVRQIGCDLTDEEKKKVYLHLTNEETNFAKDYIKENFPNGFAAFHAGAGKAPNRWKAENFAEVIKREKKDVLLTAGTMDTEVIYRLSELLSGSGVRYKILNNAPIRKAAALLKEADYYLTNDTGMMHVASYAGAKTIALFGPTPAAEWAPPVENCTYIKSGTEDVNEITIEEVTEKIKSFAN